MIKYVSHDEIDTQKWNSLVESSKNSDIFCFSWYLSNFCSWDALILNDYEGAIALPTQYKFGRRFLYQPNFVQKCNWFGKSQTPSIQSEIVRLLNSNFSSIHFNTNCSLVNTSISRTNLVLKLLSYADIKSSYSKSLRKNLSKIESYGLTIENTKEHIETTINLYKQVYGSLNPAITTRDYENLANFLHSERMDNRLEVVCIKDQSKVLASMLFLKSQQRLHYILGAPTTAGRKLNALTFGIDYIINKYAEMGYTLDFEGSSIPNVKKFYESFGAINERFYEIEFTPSTFIRLAKSAYKIFRRS